MTILASKWTIAALLLVVVLLILFLLGKKSVHTEIIIEASAVDVWEVLTDFENAKVWNEVLIPVEGELAVGNTVTYEFRENANSSSTMPATVKHMEPNQLLNQGGGLWGILTFDHRYILEAEGNATRVTIHEDYRGIMVPFWNPASVEQAYGRLLEALNQRVMALKQGQ